MPIANCLPFLDSSATKKCFHPNVREGQTTDPESFVQSEHLDWNRPTAISLDVTVEFFLNTQDRLEELYQMWHTVAYVRQCIPFSPGSMFGHASTPKNGNISEVRICWIVILGGVPTYKFCRSVSWSCNSPISADPDSVGLRCELSGSKYSACCKQLSYKATSTMLTGTKNMLDKFLHNTSWKYHSSGLAHIQIARYGKAFISKAGLTFSWKNCLALSDPPKTKSWPLRSSEDQTMRRLLSKWKTKCEMIIWCYSWTKINV